MTHSPPSRRAFLRSCFGSCCGLTATLLLTPVAARRAYGQKIFGDVVGQRPFARIEKIADGNWALVSTPFREDGSAGDRTTLSNGGLIVGEERILAVDSFRMPAGGQYMAEACKFLTGRLPTHVVHTHYHFDHIGGTRGFLEAGASPEIIMTKTMRGLAFDTYGKTVSNPKEADFSQSAIGKWGGTITDATKIIVDETKPVTLDLGGRTATIIPMVGHTRSDLIVRDDKTQTIYGGDLMWDGIFPNFMSSVPSQWGKSVAEILSNKESVIVPGHGGIVKSSSYEMQNFQRLLEEVELHARTVHGQGKSIDEAAKSLKLSETLGETKYFRAGFHEIAMDAWFKELAS